MLAKSDLLSLHMDIVRTFKRHLSILAPKLRGVYNRFGSEAALS